MTIRARRARAIRRGCQRRSQHREGLGVSELFLAPPFDAAIILAAADFRLKRYLLGFSSISHRRHSRVPGADER
jgi:hypothetical protein